MSCHVTQSGFINSTLLGICAVPGIADLCRLLMLKQPGILPTSFLMFLSTIPVAPMMTSMTSTFLFHILSHLNLEVYILVHLLCGLLLDVVITWNGHIYDLTSIRPLLLYDYVWFVAGDMSVSDDWEVPEDNCLLILHQSFRLILIPALCFHFDAIVPAYIHVHLGSYLAVPVNIPICC